MKKNITFLIVILISCVSISGIAWDWAVSGTGPANELAMDIVVDEEGNTYIVGYFDDMASFGTTTLLSSGGDDIFIAKLSSSKEWLWAKRAGGSGNDTGQSIAIDSEGNILVTGFYNDTADFGDLELSNESGANNFFLTKLDSDGNFIWAVSTTTTNSVEGRGVSVDSSNNAYVSGYYFGVAEFGDIELQESQTWDAFVAKINPDGEWLWAKRAGGTDWDYSESITVDGDGNAYIIGFFQDYISFGEITLYTTGVVDLFVAKIDTEGNWVWANSANASFGVNFDIAVDSIGNCFVTGSYNGTAEFGDHSIEGTHAQWTLFAAKLDDEGNWLWAKRAHGSLGMGYAATVDSDGNCIISGIFQLAVYFGNNVLESNGNNDIFVAKIDSDGNWLWALGAGGYGWEQSFGVTLDSTGNIFVTGSYQDIAYFGDDSIQSTDDYDLFVAKIDTSPLSITVSDPINKAHLYQNYPNPFNPETSIQFNINHDTFVSLEIYNTKGQLVKTLHKGQLQSGLHTMSWNGTDSRGNNVSSGIYLYRLITDQYQSSKTMLLLK